MDTPLLAYITTCLTPLSDTPALDASVLLARLTSKPRSWILAHPELTLTPAQQTQLTESLTRLQNGEPFPYVLGAWEFFGLEFEVSPAVLIPRPETELLVEKAIIWAQNHPALRRIADIGTGSGAIAISLAKHLPQVRILATDISPQALQVAQRNAAHHGVEQQIDFMECDLLPQTSNLEILCANLPYIPTATLHGLKIFNREPTLALDGGTDGFRLIRNLLQRAPQHLAPQALLLLEIEASLGQTALNLAHEFFPAAAVTLHQDLTGRDRLLEIRV